MSVFKILLHNNTKSATDKRIDLVESIPGDSVCIVKLGGVGIDNINDGTRLANIMANEILSDFDNVQNYTIVYHPDSAYTRHIRMQFEQYGKNIFDNTDAPVPINLYINEKNLDFVFHHRAIPLIRANDPRLRFIIDEPDDKKIDLEKILETKIRAVTDKPHQYINNIYPFKRWFSAQYLDDLFNQVLLPRIADENGKRLPYDVAVKRIRKINFSAHCFGAYVALGLEKRMWNKMRKLGYSDTEMKHIQSQMLVVALNPACPLGISKSQFISFISAYDAKLQRLGNWVTEYITENRKSELKEGKKWKLKPGFWTGNNGNVFFVKKRFELANKSISYKEHNDSHYSSDDLTDDGKLIMQFARNVTINGIKNSLTQDNEFTPLPQIHELILDGKNDKKIINKFNKMQQDAKRTMKDICNYATARIKAARRPTQQKSHQK